MSAIPKRLAVRHLFNPNTAVAAKEANVNLYWLILAGHFDVAWRMALAMLSPGPWRLSEKSDLIYPTWVCFLWLCEWLQRVRPPLDDTSYAAQLALHEFNEVLRAHKADKTSPSSSQPQQTKSMLQDALDPIATQKFEKTTWSDAELQALLATVRPDERSRAFQIFRENATEVLEAYVNGILPSTLPPPNHGAIADAIEQGERIAWSNFFGKEVAPHVMEVAGLAAWIDLREGNRAAATARLARLLPWVNLKDAPPLSCYDICWILNPVFADLLASKAFAAALGITDDAATAYYDAFASRSPDTIGAETPRPWKSVLRDYAKRLKEEGIGAQALLDNLAYCDQDCPALRECARKGRVMNAPCSAEEVAALEARLGATLPPSYREFLLTSNGLVMAGGNSLLPAEQVDWLAKLDPDTITSWNSMNDGDDDEASDEEYAIYGPDQDCIHIRPRHLRTALQISTSFDGYVLLLIPEVRFGDEWEAWLFGNKLPGAYRFRSFRDMMEQEILTEKEEP